MVFRRLRSHLEARRLEQEESEFFQEWDRQGWTVPPADGPRVALSSDEIEVACDVLWFVHLNGGMASHHQALWDRLKPVRHGDYSGIGSIVLTPEESGALAQALDACMTAISLDADERALRARLKS